MTINRIRRLAASLFALTSLACAGLVEAQQKLVLYTSNESTLNEFASAAFHRETGIKVDIVSAGSGVIMKRIQAEKDRPQGDIIWGISRSLLQTNTAYFAPYASKNINAIAAEYRDPKNLWIGNNLHLLVILQNTKAMPASEGPKTWEDLLNPKYKGKIAFTDPANSGSAFTTVTMLVDMWGGGDAGWKKVKALFANMKVLNRSALVFQGVGNGEYPLGVSLEYAGYLWSQNGAPVKTIYPADGTYAAMEGVAIIKGGPNTESAQKFVDWVNRKETREMILKTTFRRPARRDLDLSHLPGGMPELKGVKLVRYNEEAWTAKRTETLEKIKDLIQETR
ncbi:MAG: extracellular solute-binding protein [Burkholderiales bacterium]